MSASCARSSLTAAWNCSRCSRTEGAAESISTLAETLDRDYRAVHDDVTFVDEYGLLFIVDEGQSQRPYLPYEHIHLDIELVGESQGGEPAPNDRSYI